MTTTTAAQEVTSGPQLTLKKLAIYPRLSEETTAFAADVWVDGEWVGRAENDGHGGETLVRWTVSPERRRALEAALEARVPADLAGLTGGAEWAVDQIVESERVTKEVARTDARLRRSAAKHGTAAARFDVPGEFGRETIWVEYARGGEAVVRAQMLAKHGVLENWTAVA